MIRYLTAGESHGRALVGIVEGIPAGLAIDAEYVDKQLRRRQLGYGRGERMEIEADRVQVLSGVRLGKTLGSPIALLIENRDWESWKEVMAVEEPSTIHRPPSTVTVPRPGHADLAGAIKYGHDDIRNVLERSSARETAMRMALGAICRRFLERFGIQIFSYVVSIGKVEDRDRWSGVEDLNQEEIDRSPVRCLHRGVEAEMMQAIDQAKAAGDTLGGVFEVVATGVPPGLGSYVHWDRRLDGQLAQALMSIPAVKGVEIGLGFEGAKRPGSEVHDEIFYRQPFYRKTNRAGGLEGGMTNGEPIVLRTAVKPVPTLMKPLRSVDMATKEEAEAFKERADVCVVPAAAVVGEAMVALVLANALVEKFGGDSLEEMRRNYRNYAR